MKHLSGCQCDACRHNTPELQALEEKGEALAAQHGFDLDDVAKMPLSQMVSVIAEMAKIPRAEARARIIASLEAGSLDIIPCMTPQDREEMLKELRADA